MEQKEENFLLVQWTKATNN